MTKLINTFMLSAVAASACASEPTQDAAVQEARFVERVHDRFPGTQSAAIAPAFPGFHYVVKDGEVLFVRDDLSILVAGNVIDLATNKSLVVEIKARHPRKIDLSKLNLNDAIRFGHGKKRLVVFSDPDCPYCRSLQAELTKLRDVEVYLFPFPLDALHPSAHVVATAIWCQGDRAAAWDDYLIRRVEPHGAATCPTPIERNVALGKALGIRATPSIVLPDGSLIEGSQQAERIEALVAEASK